MTEEKWQDLLGTGKLLKKILSLEKDSDFRLLPSQEVKIKLKEQTEDGEVIYENFSREEAAS
jgi:hypothetical protein